MTNQCRKLLYLNEWEYTLFCAVKHSAHYKSFKTLVLGAKWEAIDSFQNY